MLFMVFDCESIGLHGETFSVGWVVIDRDGKELDHHRFACPVSAAFGDHEGRDWVMANIPEFRADCRTPREVRTAFWAEWLEWLGAKSQGIVLVADCCWPVEVRFLAACVDDDPETRRWQGPYPLHDVATARLMAGFDPLATVDRLPNELPVHDPLADARQSARLFIEALRKVGNWRTISAVHGVG